MDLMPDSICLVAALSSSFSSIKDPAMRNSHGLKLMFTDSVALPASDLNSGSFSCASCATLRAGIIKQARTILFIHAIMLVSLLGLPWKILEVSSKQYERRPGQGCRCISFLTY